MPVGRATGSSVESLRPALTAVATMVWPAGGVGNRTGPGTSPTPGGSQPRPWAIARRARRCRWPAGHHPPSRPGRRHPLSTEPQQRRGEPIPSRQPFFSKITVSALLRWRPRMRSAPPDCDLPGKRRHLSVGWDRETIRPLVATRTMSGWRQASGSGCAAPPVKPGLYLVICCCLAVGTIWLKAVHAFGSHVLYLIIGIGVLVMAINYSSC
jgi:hypothetical protein